MLRNTKATIPINSSEHSSTNFVQGIWTDWCCSRFIGRVEAKHDRTEAGQQGDAGHQEAIDNQMSAARKEMGWAKDETKAGQKLRD